MDNGYQTPPTHKQIYNLGDMPHGMNFIVTSCIIIIDHIMRHFMIT